MTSSIAKRGLSLFSLMIFANLAFVQLVKADSAPILLVVNQRDRTISFIDPSAQRQVAVLPEGDTLGHGHEVAVSPDGQTAYLPIYGDTGLGQPGTDGREILVIDLRNRRIVAHIDFGHPVRPHCPVYDPNGNTLYVTAELDNSVAVIDPRTLKIVDTIPTNQQGSHMLAVSHNGLKGYTANAGSNSVSVLDLRARRLLAIIRGIGHPQRISISADDKLIFVPDQIKPTIAIIDAATNRIVRWLLLPSLPFSTASTSDNRWLLVTLKSENKLAIVDLSSLRIVRVIAIPGAPQEIVIPPTGAYAYVSCIRGGRIAIVKIPALTLKGMIKAGAGADGMAWAP